MTEPPPLLASCIESRSAAGAGGLAGAADQKPRVPSQPSGVDGHQEFWNRVRMEATLTAQAEMFPELIVREPKKYRTLVERWTELSAKAEECGGLCPQFAVADLLEVSKQRVSQLCKSGQLEQIRFLGVCWVTGRSIRRLLQDEPNKGGLGKRRGGIWQEFAIGGKIVLANVAAVTPPGFVGMPEEEGDD